jgi:large subunit ribosomal protein L23
MQADKVLKFLRLSEKSNKQSSELGQYTFEVFKNANKHQIAEAVEQLDGVQDNRYARGLRAIPEHLQSLLKGL